MDVQFVVGLLAGFALSLLAKAIFSRIQETDARYDELCKLVAEAANLASEYWLRAGNDLEVKRLEAVIHGLQLRINLMVTLVEHRHWTIRELGSRELDDFFDALTGGDFEVDNRDADLERAREVQLSASELIVYLRDHLRRARSLL